MRSGPRSAVVSLGPRALMVVALAIGPAACCPPPEPQYAGARKVEPPPVVASAPPKNIPAPVVSRFKKPAGQPVTSDAPVKREMITEPPVGLPGPKLYEIPVKRETLAPPPPPARLARLPDDVVMRLLETGRAAFVRCFKKAIAADPTELSFKVKLRVELDEHAALTGAKTDSSNPTLDACLSRSAAWLKFPASGKRVVVELPLFYRGE